MIEEKKKEFAEHPDVEKMEIRDYFVGEGFNSEEAETSVTLLVVGGLKTLFTGGRWYTSAARFFVFGMVALLAGYLVGIVLKGSV
jgi:hypothetical protein